MEEIGMNNMGKIIIVVVLIVTVGIVIALKNRNVEPTVSQEPQTGLSSAESSEAGQTQANAQENLALPKMVDLGSVACIPCKMMAPILEELKSEFKGKLEVVFIDVRDNPDQATKYGIKLIPTQIFYDGAGKELFRHEGFYSREDILGKWSELGYEFDETGASEGVRADG
jgi:thioredoxin 1